MTSALLFLTILISNAYSQVNQDELKEITTEGEEYSLVAAEEANITKSNNQRLVDLFNLQKAKFKLINGDLKLAEFFLSRISEKESTVVSIKKRYLAMIYFIQGNFDKTLAELEDKRLNNSSHYIQNCLLKLITLMATNKTQSIAEDAINCQASTASFSKNDQFWLNSMINLKTKNTPALRKGLLSDTAQTMSDDEMARLWLKTGLYINKEKELLELISSLPESSYQSKRLREIIALMYLRTGDQKKALAFIDDIDSANAENIKGNIRLTNKEYELAFGHFRLALEKKQDSSNALERAIPLSWLLGQWNDGLAMLDNISNQSLDPRNTKAARIAFLIREKRFAEAQNELILLKIAFKNEPPFEVNIMDTYVSLVLSEKDRAIDKRKFEDSAEKSCKSFDGISCWISLQLTQWENLGKTIKRDEFTFIDKTLTVDSLKEKQVILPLTENRSIDQADIEELDGETIQLP